MREARWGRAIGIGGAFVGSAGTGSERLRMDRFPGDYSDEDTKSG